MTLNKFDNVSLNTNDKLSTTDQEYDIPLCISDIINICQDFNSLGWQAQHQIENILENGVEESIRDGLVKHESLPKIKRFLQKICDNPYFGEAIDQARDCLELICYYEDKYKIISDKTN